METQDPDVLASAATIPPKMRPPPSRAWIPAGIALVALAGISVPVVQRLRTHDPPRQEPRTDRAVVEGDRTPPLLTLHGLEPDATVDPPLHLRVDVEDRTRVQLLWTLYGRTLPGSQREREIAKLKGDHVLFIRAMDEAGNRSELRRAFRIKGAPPTTAPPSVRLGWAEGATLDPGPLPLETANADVVEVWLDGRLAKQPVTLSATTLGPGRHSVTVRARAAAGQASDHRAFVFEP